MCSTRVLPAPHFPDTMVAVSAVCIDSGSFFAGRDIVCGGLSPQAYNPLGIFPWFFLLGLAGSLVAFLVFVSVHEATSPQHAYTVVESAAADNGGVCVELCVASCGSGDGMV